MLNESRSPSALRMADAHKRGDISQYTACPNVPLLRSLDRSAHTHFPYIPLKSSRSPGCQSKGQNSPMPLQLLRPTTSHQGRMRECGHSIQDHLERPTSMKWMISGNNATCHHKATTRNTIDGEEVWKMQCHNDHRAGLKHLICSLHAAVGRHGALQPGSSVWYLS